jgi:hypothetical protein
MLFPKADRNFRPQGGKIFPTASLGRLDRVARTGTLPGSALSEPAGVQPLLTSRSSLVFQGREC